MPDLDPRTQFPLLYEREYPAVYRTIRAMVLDAHEAEDLAQETFVRAYRARAGYRPEAPPGAWLHRIAVNTAISHLRKRKLRRLLPLRLYEPPRDQETDRAEARTVVEEALACLTPKQRACVTMHFVHGYTREEIAHALGVPAGTVASRIAKAIALMRSRMGAGDPALGAARSRI